MDHKKTDSKVVRTVLISIGFISVGLAFVGIFVPLLPTVPFLLLAAACFARSSDRFYDWLLSHKIFGPTLTTYLQGKGMPVRAKLWAISTVWASVLLSIFFLISNSYIEVLLAVIGLSLSFYFLRLPTYEEN